MLDMFQDIGSILAAYHGILTNILTVQFLARPPCITFMVLIIRKFLGQAAILHLQIRLRYIFTEPIRCYRQKVSLAPANNLKSTLASHLVIVSGTLSRGAAIFVFGSIHTNLHQKNYDGMETNYTSMASSTGTDSCISRDYNSSGNPITHEHSRQQQKWRWSCLCRGC